MEFSWFYDKNAVGMFMVFDIYSSRQVELFASRTSCRGSKYVSSFFWRLIQEDDSAININIQVAIG